MRPPRQRLPSRPCFAASTSSSVKDLEFDGKLLVRLQQGVEVPEPKSDDEIVPTRDEVLAKALNVPVQDVWGGMMRLRRRRLFT